MVPIGRSGTAPHIVYVEDEADLLYIMSKRLEWEGFEVEGATNKAEALAALRRRKPDVLLLDLMLPDGSGLEVLSSVRSQLATQDLPVIVFTGLGHTEAVMEGFCSGANAYITKPVQAEKLLQAIQVVLSEPHEKVGITPDS